MIKASPAAEQTANKATSGMSMLVPGRSGEFWDLWLIISIAPTALAAIAVGLTTTSSIIARKREAKKSSLEVDRYKLTVGQQVAEANARTAEADKAAAEAFTAYPAGRTCVSTPSPPAPGGIRPHSR
jgi:hypothetical protein